MKRSVLSVAVALLLIGTACTEEKDIDLVAALSNDYEFELNTTGTGDFNVEDVVTDNDLQDILNDLDGDLLAGFKKVSIEEIEVEIIDNQSSATSVEIGVVEFSLDGQSFIPLLSNQSFDIEDGVVSVTDLNRDGVIALRNRLADLLDNGNISEITARAIGSVNGSVNTRLRVSLISSVVGTQVVELPDL
ncbi:MAG: hypothetical protein AAGF85_00030 [Bacteroidota bacterium]